MSSFGEEVGSAPGIRIWRIEDFEAVEYRESKYGQFHIGDTYIVLRTYKKSLKSDKLSWDIFFWIGSETSQDESGAAAVKTVELDDSLDGSAIQYREVQGYESPRFEGCFKKGIKYLPGGVKSGFTHIEADVDPDKVVKRLFQVKGKRNIKTKQVAFDISSMNQSDCFILDQGKGLEILVYMPPKAKKMEKFKANAAALQIRDEDHAGDASVEIIDEFGVGKAKFFEVLTGVTDIPDIPEEDGDDAAAEAEANRTVMLYKVSDAEGDISVDEVSGLPLTKDHLNTNDCFILDTGSVSGVFAWIGKGSSKDERIAVIKNAEKFLAKKNLPKHTKVLRIVDGGETAMFKQYFSKWKEPVDSTYSDCVGLGRVYPMETIQDWDVALLHKENRKRLFRAAGEVIGFMPDDGTSEDREIFRIENFEMVPMDPAHYGMFFGGDSYLIKYGYTTKEGRHGYIIYIWQGHESSKDETAASAICAVQLDEKLSGKATQVRVTQGREPRHLLKMFDGKMIVLSGGKASGFKNIHDHDTYDVDGTRMFLVRGADPKSIRTTQVPEVAKSLNSDDVYVLETPKQTWVWNGNGSSDQERELAVGVASVVSPDRDVAVLAEGEEPEEFWAAIGGKGEYPTEVDLDKPILEPRLFHCYEAVTGRFKANEMIDFEQDDLVSDDVMILDSGDEIYLWIGGESDASEKAQGLKLAKEFLAKDPTHRNEENTLIFTVNEGEEPSSFTCVFPAFTLKE